jgi:hypothetical protein
LYFYRSAAQGKELCRTTLVSVAVDVDFLFGDSDKVQVKGGGQQCPPQTSLFAAIYALQNFTPLD